MTNAEYKQAMIETMQDEHEAFRSLLKAHSPYPVQLYVFDEWSEQRMRIAQACGEQ